jgi:hypothetical protein
MCGDRSQHPFDLSAQELTTLLRAGLAVSVVQHVADPGWLPNERLGRVYGAVAAEETARIGVTLGDAALVRPRGRTSERAPSRRGRLLQRVV